ncbi:nitrate- and nitrite sensing domain-containing protein [Pseudomonas benzenivorans]|uniref:Nitrate- and nitrite sensing domain-containing protein n=1 Tax=Pseudomonas benzenivorans TaxID=556533 RepID=A0ABY5H6J9_9PSED|nr:nitrate- and nitrite sensing domain-containing protein [Pseudomonas benzenivorans]UTW07069.1 nitrate- and nitrite sensing domain-containing protein [Pseudomonas benzenivorans]
MDDFYPLGLYLGAGAAALTLAFYVLHRRTQRNKQMQIQLNIRQLALLRVLIAGFQRHRGLSNGLLCGDASMDKDLTDTRQQLDQHIREAQQLGGSHQDAWSSLIDHWSRLREGRIGTPANNLTQHHLIIRNSIYLMEDVASEVDLSEGRAALNYLPCIWREVVQAAEWAGQARALGTGIAAAGRSSAEQRVRLRFLYQKIQLLAGTAFATLQRHTGEQPQGDLFHLPHRQRVIDDFLRCIEQELLGQAQPAIAAKAYFQHATQAIDELLALVDTALQQLQPQR